MNDIPTFILVCLYVMIAAAAIAIVGLCVEGIVWGISKISYTIRTERYYQKMRETKTEIPSTKRVGLDNESDSDILSAE